MSSTVTVIGGVNQGTLNGLISVPLTGVTSTAGAALQSALTAISNQVTAGSVSFTSFDQATGQSESTTGTSATGGLYVISDKYFGPAGSPGTPGNGVYTIGSAYSTIVVKAPGTETVTASNNANQLFVLGSKSNVDLFTGTGTGSVIAAGGNDTLNLQGSQSAVLSAGDSRVKSYAGNATVVATGSASVFASVVKGYAGTMNFVNNSTAAATVAGGSGSLTVFGGAAGGTFSGGTSGNNLLVAGSGGAELVGGGNGDILAAGFNAGSTTTASGTVTGKDFLFAGVGNETLLASSATGTNLFQAGVGADVISTAGSGDQFFFGNSGTATMTGSTAANAINVYFFGTPTATGGNDVITNFNLNTDKLFAIDGTNITSITGSNVAGTPGVLVSLSDGTQITMQGITVAQASVYAGGSFI
jgi:Flp pilus assembly pilin Flp